MPAFVPRPSEFTSGVIINGEVCEIVAARYDSTFNYGGKADPVLNVEITFRTPDGVDHVQNYTLGNVGDYQISEDGQELTCDKVQPNKDANYSLFLAELVNVGGFREEWFTERVGDFLIGCKGLVIQKPLKQNSNARGNNNLTVFGAALVAHPFMKRKGSTAAAKPAAASGKPVAVPPKAAAPATAAVASGDETEAARNFLAAHFTSNNTLSIKTLLVTLHKAGITIATQRSAVMNLIRNPQWQEENFSTIFDDGSVLVGDEEKIEKLAGS